ASSATNAETSAATIPSSIRALMAARVDRITGDARAVVESAAIAGEAFTSGDAIAGEDRSSVAFDVDAALAALVRREIVRPEPGDADAYRFSHALLRDAVIDALPRRRRAELHERRAAVLAASGDAVAGDADLESIGFHLESAWRERTSIGPPDTHTRSLATRAAQALAMVGRRSVARKEWHRAAAILRRAAHLVADVPDTRRSILPDMLDALVFAREIDGATSVHDEGLRLAAGDAAERARIEVAWSRLLPVIAPEDASRRMVAVADEAISLFGAAGDDIWLGRAWMLRAIGLEDVEESILALREARAAAERSGDERTLIEVWTSSAAR
ncbi:MAG TPA: hypothetical protein VIV06_08720, partial [Candidatus Limnocylindrales bacterium]